MFAGFASFMKCSKSPETEVKPKAPPQQAEVKPKAAPQQAEVKPQATPQQATPPQAAPQRSELTPAVSNIIKHLFDATRPSLDLYWETLALRGDSLPREFSVPSYYVDELRARQLNLALSKAGYQGVVCERGACKRTLAINGQAVARFNYSELVVQNTHEHVVNMIDAAQKSDDVKWINIVDVDGVCHVSVAMEMARAAKNARRNPYAEFGRVRLGWNGNGETLAAMRARLESYCRERNLDIV